MGKPNAESLAVMAECEPILDGRIAEQRMSGGADHASRVRSYRDLKVWAKGMDLAALVYELAKRMPKEEQYRMTSQMLRSVASVSANIAEGYQRATRRDYAHFVSIAAGSLAETETFVLMATRVGLLPESATGPVLALADELSRMLRALREKLAKPNRPS